MLVVIAVFLISGVVFKNNELRYNETTEVSIQQGDTLWSIAIEVNNGRYNNQKVVWEIKKLNNLDGGRTHITPGQSIKIPVLEEE